MEKDLTFGNVAKIREYFQNKFLGRNRKIRPRNSFSFLPNAIHDFKDEIKRQ